MIPFSQLEAWVRTSESETLEFKRSTGERRSATQTLCGMLNHRGGLVLFGVEPDGRIVGQMVSDHTIEEVAQELREIDPPVFPSIERVDVSPGKLVLVVTITQGSNRPYSYKVLAFLAEHPDGAAVREIAAGLGLSGTPRSLREDLTTLKLLGLVLGEGWGRGARWRLA